jgi:hypothetical protein
VATHQDVYETRGIVAILDALGVRNATVGESVSYAQGLNELVDGTLVLLRSQVGELGRAYLGPHDDSVHIQVIRDTLVLVLEVSDPGGSALVRICRHCNSRAIWSQIPTRFSETSINCRGGTASIRCTYLTYVLMDNGYG